LAPGIISRPLAPLHLIAVASPAYLQNRILPADPTDLMALDGIAWRSSRTGRVRERLMRDAAGTEIPVKLKETIALDDPEATCRVALHGLGVTLIALCHALPHLERGTLVRLVPRWYADGGPISIYYANRTLLPAKTPSALRRNSLNQRPALMCHSPSRGSYSFGRLSPCVNMSVNSFCICSAP
jgi:DNA-binding transcriptional LysR family regulator